MLAAETGDQVFNTSLAHLESQQQEAKAEGSLGLIGQILRQNQ